MNKSFRIVEEIHNRCYCFAKKFRPRAIKGSRGTGTIWMEGEKKVEDRGTTDKQLDWEFIEWI